MLENLELPYCNGCGHTWINRSLDSALQKTDLDPRQINLVSDIGCVGLLDKYFLTNTIHTTHGRSTAFASGLQIADSVLFNGATKHIVMIGDGGATIGLLHLVEAARLNLDMTVILHNNFVYGMTGGQNSGFTPLEFVTASTRAGNFSQPIHIAELLAASGASHIERKLATDSDLDETIYAAIEHPGFSLIEVIELCTGYATKWNKLSKNDIAEILEKSNASELGRIKKEKKNNYAENYKTQYPQKTKNKKNQSTAITAKALKLESELSVIFAGTAGEGVQFCSKSFMQSLVAQSLFTVQKNDNPVTIGTGFSMSEIKASSDEILYSAIESPDFLVITSADGYKRVKQEIQPNSFLIVDSSLEIEGLTSQNSFSYPFRAKAKRNANFMALGKLIQLIEKSKKIKFDLKIFEQIINKNSEAIIAAIEMGYDLN